MIDLTPESKRVNLIVRLSCIFWILTKVISFKLWTSERLFPLIPPFSFLENFSAETHLSLFYSAIAGIFLIFIFPQNRVFIFLTILIEFCSCMLDQNRWQPWEYQYLITILFAFLYKRNPKQFGNYFAFLIIIIYFNSGLHKLTESFLHNVWEDRILRRFFGISEALIQQKWLHYAGLILGLIELISAPGLIFFRKKKVFAWLLVGMHLFILLLILPTGLNYNIIFWPWNVMMILLIYNVYISEPVSRVSFYHLTKGANILPFIFIGILPLLGNFGIFDNFLSFDSYSPSPEQLEICVKEDNLTKDYAPYYSQEKSFCGSGTKVLNANSWALEEMNVNIYPEQRVYHEIIRKWKQRNPHSKAVFHIYQYPYKTKNITENE